MKPVERIPYHICALHSRVTHGHYVETATWIAFSFDHLLHFLRLESTDAFGDNVRLENAMTIATHVTVLKPRAGWHQTKALAVFYQRIRIHTKYRTAVELPAEI